jgi:hypothetical protein
MGNKLHEQRNDFWSEKAIRAGVSCEKLLHTDAIDFYQELFAWTSHCLVLIIKSPHHTCHIF